jgi:membrane associated rhomboid family serine protease
MPRHELERRVDPRPRRGIGVRPDTEPWLRVGPATIGLVLSNVAVFVARTIDSGLDDVLGLRRGWNEVLEQPWTLLSVAFTGANLLHLALAVGVILLAGGAVERRVGSLHLLGIYVASGVAGSMAMATAASAGVDASEISLGASAAFLGLVGALAALPTDKALGSLHLPQVAIVVTGLNLIQPVLGVGDWTSSAAHLAGLAVGAAWIELGWRPRRSSPE